MHSRQKKKTQILPTYKIPTHATIHILHTGFFFLVGCFCRFSTLFVVLVFCRRFFHTLVTCLFFRTLSFSPRFFSLPSIDKQQLTTHSHVY